MGKKQNKVVLDTNVIISAIVFYGKPLRILELALDKRFRAYTSKFLLSELQEVLIKKFDFTKERVEQIEKKLLKVFKLVYPKQTVEIVRDKTDNRVLEVALEANCDYIISGDKDLLDLHAFKNIVIVKPEEFLSIMQN